MSQAGAILRAKLAAVGHAAAAVRRESKLKVAFVATSVAMLWLVTFALAHAGLVALDRLGTGLFGTAHLSLVDLLVPRLLSVLALVLFVLLAFSNLVVAYATLYRSREVELLLVSPLAFRDIFLARFGEIVAFSSWSTAYLGSPVVLAYGLVRHAPWPFYLAAVTLFVPFVVIPAALGATLAVLAVRTLPRVPRAALAGVALLLLAAVFAGFRAQLDPQFREVADLAGALRLTAHADSPLLPSFWLTDGVLAASRGAAAEAAYDLMLLLANALFFTFVAAEVAQRTYHAGWSGLAGAGRRTPRRPAARRDLLGALAAPLPGPARWLTVKDVRLFLREPSQWSQFAVFFGMLVLYVANMRAGSRGFSTAFWQSWITLLNGVAALLVLATLTTRFVFPLVSLEGRRFWILGQAPVSRRSLVVQKFWLSVAFSAAVTGGLAVLSGLRLHLAAVPFAYSVFTVATASFALSGLAVGLGSLYPNLQEASPARIVSGLGGTLTFILSVAYVVLAAGAETIVLQWPAFGGSFGGAAAYPLVVAGAALANLGITALTVWVPLRLGAAHLERLEM